jgi:hypothetical protein
MQWVWVLNAGFALPYYCTAFLFSISYKLDYYVTKKLLYYNSKKKHLISTYIKFSVTKKMKLRIKCQKTRIQFQPPIRLFLGDMVQ